MAMAFTSENFEQEVLKSDQVVLVDFYADWCGPCKMIGPVIDELATEYEGKAKIGKLNVDNSEDIAAKYAVMTIPTLIVFKGGEVVEKVVGVKSKEEIAKMIDDAK